MSAPTLQDAQQKLAPPVWPKANCLSKYSNTCRHEILKPSLFDWSQQIQLNQLCQSQDEAFSFIGKAQKQVVDGSTEHRPIVLGFQNRA